MREGINQVKMLPLRVVFIQELPDPEEPELLSDPSHSFWGRMGDSC